MDFTASLRLIHANFFFVDIVGLCRYLAMSTKTQIKKIEAFKHNVFLIVRHSKSVPL